MESFGLLFRLGKLFGILFMAVFYNFSDISLILGILFCLVDILCPFKVYSIRR